MQSVQFIKEITVLFIVNKCNSIQSDFARKKTRFCSQYSAIFDKWSCISVDSLLKKFIVIKSDRWLVVKLLNLVEIIKVRTLPASPLNQALIYSTC